MLIILSSYRPGACGVTDHAIVLGAACKSIGEYVKYCDGPNEAESEISRASAGETVFITVTLYGYQKYGFITRLLSIAKQAKKRGIRVASYFHELPAPLFPLRKVSMLIPAQVLLCQSLASHSDVVFVNQARGLQWLHDTSGRMPIYVPTWSNVGEADAVLDVQSRRNRIVVFGTPQKRERIYTRMQEMGDQMAMFISNIEIVDIGAPCATRFPEAWSVCTLGQLDSVEVGRVLSGARFGMFTASTGETSKSGAFAAYCAYGVIPVNVELQQTSNRLQDPRLGHEFTDLTGLAADIKALQQLQCGARAWYAKYSVASSLARVLTEMGFHC
jgi:hypothetical protein